MPGPLEISVREVKQIMDAGKTLHLIDVREPNEFAVCKIEGAELIPMRTVPGELQDITSKAESAPVIVFCHHGMRSLNVVNWLREQGVKNCASMAGGIDAWSATVDPTVPRY
jgi:rhodanese-related sulfurtransferase